MFVCVFAGLVVCMVACVRFVGLLACLLPPLFVVYLSFVWLFVWLFVCLFVFVCLVMFVRLYMCVLVYLCVCVFVMPLLVC